MTRDTAGFSQLCRLLEHKWAPTRRIVNVIIFLKKGVSIKTNGLFGNPSYTQKIPHGFGHQKDNL
jgi:hypothetical protein